MHKKPFPLRSLEVFSSFPWKLCSADLALLALLLTLPSAFQGCTCAPTRGVGSQIQFCHRTPKISFLPPKRPSPQLPVQPQEDQLGTRLGAKTLTGVCCRASGLAGGSGAELWASTPLLCELLCPGHDRGLTRTRAQGLGLCPGKEDDQRGKKPVPLPFGR